MNPWPFFIGADALSLTTSWLTVALGAVEGDATTEATPTLAWLVCIDVRLSGIQGASTVTFYLSEDEVGDERLHGLRVDGHGLLVDQLRAGEGLRQAVDG